MAALKILSIRLHIGMPWVCEKKKTFLVMGNSFFAEEEARWSSFWYSSYDFFHLFAITNQMLIELKMILNDKKCFETLNLWPISCVNYNWSNGRVDHHSLLSSSLYEKVSVGMTKYEYN